MRQSIVGYSYWSTFGRYIVYVNRYLRFMLVNIFLKLYFPITWRFWCQTKAHFHGGRGSEILHPRYVAFEAITISDIELQERWKFGESIFHNIMNRLYMNYWIKFDWSYTTDSNVKGILWDRRWSTPSIRILSHTCWYFFGNAFLIIKLRNPPSFRAIRALIASQSTFEI